MKVQSGSIWFWTASCGGLMWVLFTILIQTHSKQSSVCSFCRWFERAVVSRTQISNTSTHHVTTGMIFNRRFNTRTPLSMNFPFLVFRWLGKTFFSHATCIISQGFCTGPRFSNLDWFEFYFYYFPPLPSEELKSLLTNKYRVFFKAATKLGRYGNAISLVLLHVTSFNEEAKIAKSWAVLSTSAFAFRTTITSIRRQEIWK